METTSLNSRIPVIVTTEEGPTCPSVLGHFLVKTAVHV